MAPSKPALALTVVGLLACAGMGAFGTFGAGFNDGLFAAIENSVGHAQPDPYFVSGPKPYRLVYTGFEPFDRQLRTLISFFVMLINGPKTGDIVLVYWYLMAQFCAGWSLLFLEGMRRGNADRAVSWTGVMGLIFQNITYTITVPLYLILHLFTSPLVSVTPATSDLAAVDAIDSMTFPITSLMAFWGPAVLMALPSPSARVSAAMHYSWNALWQPFPATQGLYRGILKLIIPQAHDAGIPQSSRLNRQALSYVYGFVALVSVASHLGLLAAALAPASLVPDEYRALVAEVDFFSAFVPHWPGNPPVVTDVGAGGARISGAGLPELVKLFLQWDIYCGGAAILIWAVYLHGAAVPGRSLAAMLPKVAVWTLLGGFPAAATVMLWERDWAVFVEDKSKKTQ